ncbi:ERF family protein [Oceanobacillus caeni]|uniref:ERF family protein n=1 Tax=Oceanobacillus caeni TaxID=405946 RepID=UPI002149D065|nr:ERF family protein [Oceanobacillus caeni]MCR1833100.1 ERF family protein [Oceanobacillus caeni]
MGETNFYQRIVELQNELVAPKNNYNSFGKYKYRSAEDILEAVKPLNKKYDLFLNLSDEPVLVGDWHYVKVTAKLIDTKDPNNQVISTAYARESLDKKGQDHSQITGTASSYARKYALNGLYLIDDTKDADTDEYQNQNQPNNNAPRLITQKQVGAIKTKALRFAQARNQSVDKVYEVLKIVDLTKLTAQQASAAIKQLDTWLSNAEKQGA